jgi:amino acid adenylation domain-containing protein
MSELSERIASLTPEQRAAFEKLLTEETGEVKEESIPRRPQTRATNVCPLSFAQQRCWFLEQFLPGTSVYNVPMALRITGPLNVDILERSLTEIVRRHEVLRATFIAVDDDPMQVLVESARFRVPVVDLRSIPQEQRQAEMERLAQEEARRPFDLARGPLYRARLFRVGEQSFVLVLTIHHIVSDGWSMGVLFRELKHLYEAYLHEKPPSLPELPIQYGDYAIWQRQWLQGERLRKQVSFWKEYLDGAPHFLELPTDRPRPRTQTFNGAIESLVLPQSLSQGLHALARKEGVTLFMVMLAALQTLLHRYTGQEDIVIGTPIAGRTRKELEGMIGFFVNTLALRGDLSGNPRFRELLWRVKESALAAYAHSDLPFEKLVEEIRPERRLSQTPLFQVMLMVQNIEMDVPQIEGLSLELLELHSGTAKFDLTISVIEKKEGLRIGFIYNTDLFDSATMVRMLGHFQILLKSIIDNPDQRIGELSLLTPTERQQLLTQWNNINVHYPKRGCLHTLFEEQVERRPEAIALTFEGEHITYQELNRRANRLAHHLRHLGVGAETLVGICAERSIEMVVGLLGILKAGGAYLPLDPTYPKDRLAFMLEDAAAPVLITQPHLLQSLPEHRAKVICLAPGADMCESESDENPHSTTTPDNLAYVIYTSGSTGKPKGVQVTHYNVTRLMDATWEWFRFDEQDVWTLFHSYAFDFSVWELWGALLYGGRVTVVPYMLSRSPESFYELLCKEGVTVLNQTPSAFRQLIRAEETCGVSDKLALRLVIFGGEALDLQSLKPWLERHGDRKPQLVNMYGITETTVHVTYRPLTEEDIINGAGSMIGRPIPDLQVYLLDQYQQLVPLGVPGEMYVGGAGVARGYLHRPELTAERFLPHPFDDTPGARLYRSGDLARRWPNGDLEYLGRIDQQLKIRGFRIEAGEVESAIGQHEGVRESVVTVMDDSSGERRLVAYIVPDSSGAPTTSELRRFLQQKLPEYMVPSIFVLLDRLPLTANGKVDRRALPVPEATRPELEAAYVAPRNPVEEAIASVLAEILSLERVGVFDNFFELGGTSLMATRLTTRLHKLYQIDLPVRVIFERPTVAAMAEVVAHSLFQEEDVPEMERWLQELEVATND